jgi:hypothetical protein
MIPEPGEPGLCALLPSFRRAREYRLYDERGRRYLDLWQADGHALLGHRAARVSAAMKNAISRGLVADLPSGADRRLTAALRRVLPSHPFVRLYSGLGRCLAGLSAWRGRETHAADIPDPAVPEAAERPGSGEVIVWRPFVPCSLAAGAVVPVLPFAMGGGPWALCFRQDAGRALPPSEPVSAVLLEGAARALAGLTQYTVGPLGPQILRLGCPSWRVAGVYVTPLFDRGLYPAVFEAFLREGVVLSPRYDCPSLLPASASEGEVALAIGLFRANPAQ